MDKAPARALMKLLPKADDLVISAEEEQSTQVKFANNKVIVTEHAIHSGLQVYAVVGKKCIGTGVHDLSPKGLRDIASKIMTFSSFLQPNEEYAGIAKGPFEYKKIARMYDPKVASLKGASLISKALATVPPGFRAAGVLESSSNSHFLITSGGVEATERQTNLYFSVRVLAQPDASGHLVHCSSSLRGFDPVAMTLKAAELARSAMNPLQGESGIYDVIFEPLPAANLLEHVGRSAGAFALEAGFSFLVGKLGSKVASSALSLYDDPQLPEGMNSTSFDEEGFPTTRKPIIEDGILKTYLHNTSTAVKYKTKTTGNAGLVAPEPFNLVVRPGKETKEQLIKNIKKGLLITNVWYTRFQDYEQGLFSTIPRDAAFLIEDGKIIRPVKGIRISDSLPRMIKELTPAKESQQIAGWEVELPVVTPPLLVRRVNITKSTDLEAD